MICEGRAVNNNIVALKAAPGCEGLQGRDEVGNTHDGVPQPVLRELGVSNKGLQDASSVFSTIKARLEAWPVEIKSRAPWNDGGSHVMGCV